MVMVLTLISFVHSIVEEGGTTFSFGRACERCHVKTVIQVHNPQLYWKVIFFITSHARYILHIRRASPFHQLLTEADLGFAHAYINGYVSFSDNREGLLNFILVRPYSGQLVSI
jgi:hypothetical protein